MHTEWYEFSLFDDDKLTEKPSDFGPGLTGNCTRIGLGDESSRPNSPIGCGGRRRSGGGVVATAARG